MIAVASVGVTVIATNQSKAPDPKKEFQAIYGSPVYTDKSPDPKKLAAKLDNIEEFAKKYPDAPQLSTLISAAFSDSAYVQVPFDQFLETYARFDPYLQSVESRTVADGEIRSALNHYTEKSDQSFSPTNYQSALDLFALVVSSRESNVDMSSYLSRFAALNQNRDWQIKLIQFAKSLSTQPQDPNIYTLIEYSANLLGKPMKPVVNDWNTNQPAMIAQEKTPVAVIIARKIPTEPQFAQFLKEATAKQANGQFKIILHSIDSPSKENQIPAGLPKSGLQFTYGSTDQLFKLFPKNFQGVVLYTDRNANYIGYDHGQKLLPISTVPSQNPAQR
jgi:hypothetical protein